MIDWTKNKYGELSSRYPIHAKVVRYLISGGTAAFTNILLLYLFTEIFGIWYIASAAMAFSIAFIVSFTLQKFWTFQDVSKDQIHRQAMVYLTVALFNLFINTGLLYMQVEYLGIHYIVAQLIASVFIAVESFFIYQIFIFKKKTENASSI
ncbi:MAG: GtrA family protein [Candidatus Paceibacterota bacterium]|jgi:putative flippase GtrA